MPQKVANYIGQKVDGSRLTVIERVENYKDGSAMWKCRCDCGNEIVTLGRSLNSGHTKSCGCWHKESAQIRFTTHGKSKANSRLYRIWRNIKGRCVRHHRYRDRGITICREWVSDFVSFEKWAVAAGYQDGLEIDRIDNNSGYSPDNCRWVSHRKNINNRENTLFIEYGGQKMPFGIFAEKYGGNMNRDTLYNRIFVRGLSIEEALNKPIQVHRKGSRNARQDTLV